MGYMIEGGGSKTLSKAKKWLYSYPKESHELLTLLTDVIIDYLVMQVEHGAQILQVFDSSAEYLNKDMYATFALPYLKRIRDEVSNKIAHLQLKVPLVLFAKGAGFSMTEQAKLGYDVLGVDWTLEPQNARNLVEGTKTTLQGNLDPCALYAPKEHLEKMTKDMIQKFGVKNYIVNLGHGIYPDAGTDAVETFINAVHSVKLN